MLVAAVMTAGGVAEDTRDPSEPRRVTLGEGFRLKIGEAVLIGEEGLRVGFESVPTDSRCPKGENCIWEGDAVVGIWVRRGSAEKRGFNLHTSGRGPGAADYDGWSVRLVALDPYPVSGRPVRRGDYVATLEVTRGSSGEGEIRQ
jgi:hypothetical protein